MNTTYKSNNNIVYSCKSIMWYGAQNIDEKY